MYIVFSNTFGFSLNKKHEINRNGKIKEKQKKIKTFFFLYKIQINCSFISPYVEKYNIFSKYEKKETFSDLVGRYIYCIY